MPDTNFIKKLIDKPLYPNAAEWAMDAEDVLYEFSDLSKSASAAISNVKMFGNTFPNHVDFIVATLKRALKRSGGIQNVSEESGVEINDRSVFIVHGHDSTMKSEVARVLEQQGLDALILSEQPPNGTSSLMEKLERYSQQAAFAVVLYSRDDITETGERARQNVVFEHGLFIGRLGRSKVVAMKNGDVEGYSDIDGIEYIHYENHDWRYKLIDSLKLAGFDVSRDKIK